MFLIKNSFCFVVLCGFLFCENWVLEYKNEVFYEDDFFGFFEEIGWASIKSAERKRTLFFDYIKRVASVYEARRLGLDLDFKVEQKLDGRFKRLLVNEYYMKDFLLSVTPKQGLAFCQKNLKKELFLKHILVETESLALLVMDSLRLGKGFSSLASSFSVDPSAKNNLGVLGWVGVGATVPAFQNKAFSLCVGCVGHVKTDFGHHIIQVDSVRSSASASLSKEEYNDLAFRFATAYIKKPLVELAAQHDSTLLQQFGVVFDFFVLDSFVSSVKKELNVKKRREEVGFLGMLEKVSVPLVVYDGSYLNGVWFANKLSDPLYNNPFFDSVESFLKEMKLIVLRDIVFGLALKKKIDKNNFFKKQFKSVSEGVLEKEFLKYLVNSATAPTKKEVENYYYKNQQKLFTNKTSGEPFGLSSSYGSIEAILLKEKQEKEKQAFFDSLEGPNVKINEVWLNGF